MKRNLSTGAVSPGIAIGVLFGITFLFLAAIFLLGGVAMNDLRIPAEEVLGSPLPQEIEVEHSYSSEDGDTVQLIDRVQNLRITIGRSSDGPESLDKLIEDVYRYQTDQAESAPFLVRFTSAHLTLKRLKAEKKASVRKDLPFQFFSKKDEAHYALGVLRNSQAVFAVIAQHPKTSFSEEAIEKALQSLPVFQSQKAVPAASP